MEKFGRCISFNTYIRQRFTINGMPFQIWEEIDLNKFQLLTFFYRENETDLHDTIEEAVKIAMSIELPAGFENVEVNDSFVVLNGKTETIVDKKPYELTIEWIEAGGKFYGCVETMRDKTHGHGSPLTVYDNPLNSKDECINHYINYGIELMTSEDFINLTKNKIIQKQQLGLFDRPYTSEKRQDNKQPKYGVHHRRSLKRKEQIIYRVFMTLEEALAYYDEAIEIIRADPDYYIQVHKFPEKGEKGDLPGGGKLIKEENEKNRPQDFNKYRPEAMKPDPDIRPAVPAKVDKHQQGLLF